ncbi:MAG: hypothetical protein M3Z48_00110 [Lactobacillus sp.]|uniref:Uncharacterized protein n=1 Tax=Bacillus thuringiensis TaxID=1428 RepID=A0ABD6RDW5_BACTU|nr:MULTISPECIES: hypothetical protein [Bacillus cereus group]MCT6901614.1 hypothetical protein [Lactobacillus sp.]OPD55045.1 hypothetical protein BVF97_01295 [Bacillus thuringiensis]PDY30941.1 hypothetical protein COM84_04395 [Bacillus thuringiensis]PFF14700.1 hypothetical protein CN343_07100 [Bacillus cereus]PFP01738.1 hypothetical protein COJ91_25640 [Bacillus thuringiensis]
MTLDVFLWSVIASIVAAVIFGGAATYKITNRNKTKKKINQKGNNNTAYMDSTVNINSDNKNKDDK